MLMFGHNCAPIVHQTYEAHARMDKRLPSRPGSASLRWTFRAGRTPQARPAAQASGETISNFAGAAGAARRDRNARGTSGEALGALDVCGFRAQPEYRDQQTPRSAGRRITESALHRDSSSPWYRFIAPFTTSAARPAPIAVPLPTFPDGQPHAGSSTTPATTLPVARSRLLHSTTLVAAGTVTVMFAVAAWTFWPRPAPQVLDFVQLTADGEAKTGPLFSDGVNLFFQEATIGMKQVSLKGGQAAPLRPDLGLMVMLDYSSKRGTLLVKQGGSTVEEPPLWEVPLPAGSPQPLGGGLRGYHAKWSPDGERVAITGGSL